MSRRNASYQFEEIAPVREGVKKIIYFGGISFYYINASVDMP